MMESDETMMESDEKKLMQKVIKKIDRKDYFCIERSKFDLTTEASIRKRLIQKTRMKNESTMSLIVEHGYKMGTMAKSGLFSFSEDFFVYDPDSDRVIKYGQEETEIKEVDFLKMPNPKLIKSNFQPKSIFDLKTKVRDPDEATTIRFLTKWVLKQDISTEIFYELSTAGTTQELVRAITKCTLKGQRNYSEEAGYGLKLMLSLLIKIDASPKRR